jgi:hypothetical protein
MPTTIGFPPPDIAMWNTWNRGFRIIWNTDFLAVAGFAALGLILTLGFMLQP